MNLLDAFLIGVVLLLGLLGFRRGFVRSLSSLAALLIAIVISKPLAAYGLQIFLGKEGSQSPVLFMASRLYAAIAVYFICRILTWFLHRLIERGEGSLQLLNRASGGAIGLTQGVVLAVFVLVVLVYSLGPESIADRRRMISQSFLVKQTAKRVPASLPRMLRIIDELKDNDRSSLSDPAFVKLLTKSKIDPKQFQQQLDSKNYLDLLTDKKVHALLQSEELRRLMAAK